MSTTTSKFYAKYADKIMVEPNSGCWLWTGPTTAAGYPKIGVCYAHRMCREMEDSAPLGCLLVRHKCDTPSCVNPDHLLRGTKKDNAQDAVERGRIWRPKGEMSPSAKLTESLVSTARGMARSGMCVRSIAKTIGFEYETTRSAVRGDTWTYITNPSPVKGEVLRGSRNPIAILNESSVSQIKAMLESGESHSSIADKFGVSRPSISAISSGRNWRHVK